jgi:hypothetical protein
MVKKHAQSASTNTARTLRIELRWVQQEASDWLAEHRACMIVRGFRGRKCRGIKGCRAG